MPLTTCPYKEPKSHCQCQYLVQKTIVICLPINEEVHFTLVGTDGGSEGSREGVYGLCHHLTCMKLFLRGPGSGLRQGKIQEIYNNPEQTCTLLCFHALAHH